METPLEKILMTAYKEEMIAFMYNHPEYFDEAVSLAISDKQPYAWRSAWLLFSCMDEDDKRVKPKKMALIDAIEGKKDGHQRELIKVATKMKLNEDEEGHLFNTCMNLWENIQKQPSVRYICITFILGFAEKYPEIKNEIIYLTEDQYLETLSPGIKHAIIKMVEDIKE